MSVLFAKLPATTLYLYALGVILSSFARTLTKRVDLWHRSF